MSILNSHDIQMMNDDVNDIIIGWQTFATIKRPRPLDQQTYYSATRREYTGPIDFDEIVVNVERKDITNYLLSNVRADLAGLIEDGDQLYAVPLKYTVDGVAYQLIINVNDMFILSKNPSDTFVVKAIKDRIGEQLVVLKRQVGGTPSGW